MMMMSANVATLGFPNLKVFWKKDYGVIIYAHDVTKNLLSCCDCSIFRKKVPIVSIL